MCDAFLDIKALAKLLNISLRTTETLIKTNQLPMYIRVGHQRRWRQSDIDKFFTQKQKQTFIEKTKESK